MDKFYGQEELRVPAGEFKQRCLALLDQVAETGMPIVVTKRGKPVARVVPAESAIEALAGSIHVLAENDEELYSTGEVWDVDRSS
jgi:prevent-host-death family protein